MGSHEDYSPRNENQELSSFYILAPVSTPQQSVCKNKSWTEVIDDESNGEPSKTLDMGVPFALQSNRSSDLASRMRPWLQCHRPSFRLALVSPQAVQCSWPLLFLLLFFSIVVRCHRYLRVIDFGCSADRFPMRGIVLQASGKTSFRSICSSSNGNHAFSEACLLAFYRTPRGFH